MAFRTVRIVGLCERGQPVLQLPLQDLRLGSHAVAITAVEFDEGPERFAVGVLGEVQDERQKLALPIDHLQPKRRVRERQGFFEEIGPGFRLAEQFDEPVSVLGRETRGTGKTAASSASPRRSPWRLFRGWLRWRHQWLGCVHLSKDSARPLIGATLAGMVSNRRLPVPCLFSAAIAGPLRRPAMWARGSLPPTAAVS